MRVQEIQHVRVEAIDRNQHIGEVKTPDQNVTERCQKALKDGGGKKSREGTNCGEKVKEKKAEKPAC